MPKNYESCGKPPPLAKAFSVQANKVSRRGVNYVDGGIDKLCQKIVKAVASLPCAKGGVNCVDGGIDKPCQRIVKAVNTSITMKK